MNTIAAKAVDPANNMSTASVNISLDSTPPQVAINSPPDGYTTTADSIDVTGIINDIVRGTVNDNQGSVLVNGVTAEIANRNFTAHAIPLIAGANTITAAGSDQWGNIAGNSITVNRDTTPRVTLNIESGNGQSGFIGSTLANPLVASLKKANNDPIANETVIFRVVDNNGTLYDTVSGNGMRIVAGLTDTGGNASALLTLGSWAGSGNNRVEVSATGVEGTVFFIASGMMKPPAAIYAAQGSQQRGAVNQLLPEPLVAFVTDEGHNPLKDVPVIFRVVEGGGHFTNGPDTLTTITINSDSDGRATVGFILGPTAGNDGNIMEAIFDGNTLPPASFTATGLVPGDPGNTRVSGVVLDNSNNPIGNVTMKVEGTTREAISDDNGLVIKSDLGVGVVKAGWHCGGNPAPTGSANNCPECKTGNNNSCVPSAGGSCTDDGNVCTDDTCQSGSCAHPTKPDGTVNVVECCFNGQVIPKSVSDFNTLLTKCPASTQFTYRNHEIDGCSTPPIIAIITPGLSVQYPVGGHCGFASTAFGQPEPPFPHGSSPIDLPCNKHDVCYQTCNSL